MARIKLAPHELAGELKARAQKTPDVLRRAAVLAAHRGRSIMVRRTPTDRGQMKNAWRVRRLGDIATKKEMVDLVNDAPYAGIVEMGARPHSVSREGWDAIYGWVYRHRQYFAAGRTTKGRKKTMKKYVMEGTSARSGAQAETGYNPIIAAITWGIVKRIREKGQLPTYFVRDSMDDLRDAYSTSVERQIAQYAKRKAKAWKKRHGG
jgi:hypothetical protein